MKTQLFVVGDVHGQFSMFEEVLSHWNEEEQQLLLIGDLGDRGENPKACFELADRLIREKGAICLKGNHEDMLLQFLNHPEENYALYRMNGGMKTIQSFLHAGAHEEYSPTEMALMLESRYPFLRPFLENLTLYYEWENYVFAHAGVDLSKRNWRNTSYQDFVWIREGFYDRQNRTGKTIVFGHTITPMLHGDNRTSDLWITDDGKIGIDGGAVYGGSLHGVIFDKNGIVRDIQLKNTGYVWDGSI